MIFGIPLFCIACSFFIGYFGRNRKLGFWGYFFASLLLTPLIGILLVIVSDNKKQDAGGADDKQKTEINL